MGFWTDRAVRIPQLTWRRFYLIAKEVQFYRGGDLAGWHTSELAERLINNVLTEYVRQYLEESTEKVARMVAKQMEAGEEPMQGVRHPFL
jgi:hypothetical protein